MNLPLLPAEEKSIFLVAFLFLLHLVWVSYNVLWIFFRIEKKKSLFLSLFYIISKTRIVVVIITENTLAADVPRRKINCCFYCCCRVLRSCLVELLFSLLFSLSLSLSLSPSLFLYLQLNGIAHRRT